MLKHRFSAISMKMTFIHSMERILPLNSSYTGTKLIMTSDCRDVAVLPRIISC